MYIQNLFHCLFATYVIERCFSNQELVGQYTQAPKIHGHIILSSFQNLRRDIVKGSTVCLSSFSTNGSPSEITEFADSIRHHNIFWFNISMNNSLLMQILNAFCKLFHLGGSIKLAQSLSLTLFKLKEESALFHKFKNQVDILLVIEETIQFQNVFVLAIVLNFNLLNELINQIVLLYYLLAYLFQSKHGLGLLMNGLVDDAKFTLSQ